MAITASCNVVATPVAIVIGGIGGTIMSLAADAIQHRGIDDGVDAVAIHGVAGAWGTLAVGLFGNLELLGTGLSRYSQIAVQLLGIGGLFCLELWRSVFAVISDRSPVSFEGNCRRRRTRA